MTVKAPITETLASALIMLTPWKKDRSFVDPFCGSGTFPIEAAMMAADIAPGMNRSFLAEDWKHVVPRRCWYSAVEEAQDRVNLQIETDIQGYDIDPEALKAARANAKMAGCDQFKFFHTHFSYFPFLKCNAFYNISLKILDGKNTIFQHCICRRISLLGDGNRTGIQKDITLHLLCFQYMCMPVDQDISLA